MNDTCSNGGTCIRDASLHLEVIITTTATTINTIITIIIVAIVIIIIVNIVFIISTSSMW